MPYLFQDWKPNAKNSKGQLVLVLFRLANIAKNNKIAFVLLLPYLVFYRFFIEWVLGIEMPYKLDIGKGLRLYHGHSLVINPNTVIGNNCTLRHSTTIGNKTRADGSFTNSPRIGNNVEIGSNVCIIGPIHIGNNVQIGAGSVVLKDVPDNCMIAGNPAVIKRYLTS